MALQKNARDVVQALGELLTPNAQGEVPFGADNEPLRLSQVESLEAIRDNISQGETLGHIVKPGGTGKTREGIALAYAMHRHGHQSLFVVPTQQALTDFVKKAKKLCPDLDVGSFYEDEKHIGNLTFVTYQSLLARTVSKEAAQEAAAMDENAVSSPAAEKHIRINPKDYELVVWDEAHMYLTPNAQNLLKKFDHAVNIGFTATPRYYEGKEVGAPMIIDKKPVVPFGKKFYELSVKKALERGEISDYENVLINTGIKTGLKLTSPDQEESAAVSQAINLPDRNLIYAELYKNAEVKATRGGITQTHTLAGEPTIVFAASVNHVHDIADTINKALTPLLKSDQEFRQKLISKGINPDDPDLVIAAPIHSGAGKAESGGKSYPGMDLSERNKLVEKYHARKVLMLVSTSVLQQSFDSDITSVVMDAVPRQTYVGVGQAAMRALRPKDGKFAILINTEDGDHQSHTFNKFVADRGREEGVVVEISKDHAKKPAARPASISLGASPRLPIAHYDMVVGNELIDLTKKRIAQDGRLYVGDGTLYSRGFTMSGIATINALMERIRSDDKEAEARFVETIMPWLEDKSSYLKNEVLAPLRAGGEPREWDSTKLSDKLPVREMQERWENARIDVLYDMLEGIRQGKIQSWTRFANRLQSHLKEEYAGIVQSDSTAARFAYTMPIDDGADRIWFDLESRAAKIPPGRDEELTRTMRTLSLKQEAVLKMRQLEDKTFPEIGMALGISVSSARQLEAKALRQMRHSSRADRLKPWAEYMPDKDEIERLQHEKDHPISFTRHTTPPSPELLRMRVAIGKFKKHLADMTEGKLAKESLATIEAETGLSTPEVFALSSVTQYNVSPALFTALTPEKMAALKENYVAPEDGEKFDITVAKLEGLIEKYQAAGGQLVSGGGPYKG